MNLFTQNDILATITYVFLCVCVESRTYIDLVCERHYDTLHTVIYTVGSKRLEETQAAALMISLYMFSPSSIITKDCLCKIRNSILLTRSRLPHE